MNLARYNTALGMCRGALVCLLGVLLEQKPCDLHLRVGRGTAAPTWADAWAWPRVNPRSPSALRRPREGSLPAAGRTSPLCSGHLVLLWGVELAGVGSHCVWLRFRCLVGGTPRLTPGRERRLRRPLHPARTRVLGSWSPRGQGAWAASRCGRQDASLLGSGGRAASQRAAPGYGGRSGPGLRGSQACAMQWPQPEAQPSGSRGKPASPCPLRPRTRTVAHEATESRPRPARSRGALRSRRQSQNRGEVAAALSQLAAPRQRPVLRLPRRVHSLGERTAPRDAQPRRSGASPCHHATPVPFPGPSPGHRSLRMPAASVLPPHPTPAGVQAGRGRGHRGSRGSFSSGNSDAPPLPTPRPARPHPTAHQAARSTEQTQALSPSSRAGARAQGGSPQPGHTEDAGNKAPLWLLPREGPPRSWARPEKT